MMRVSVLLVFAAFALGAAMVIESFRAPLAPLTFPRPHVATPVTLPATLPTVEPTLFAPIPIKPCPGIGPCQVED